MPVTETADRVALSGFLRDLPREGRLLLSVVGISSFGTGLVLPFWVVYLHEVRGFGLDVTGFLLALQPLAGFVGAAVAGPLIDRVGARRVDILSLLLSMVGELVMVFASSVPIAAVGLALVGASWGIGWPTGQALVASVLPPEVRQRYFGMSFALLNLGIGVGGIVGGLVANVHHLISFQAMYLGDAVSYLPPLLLLLGPLRHIGKPAPKPEADHPEASYLQVWRAPGMAAVTVLGFLAAFVGYAQLNSGLPAYSRAISEISTRSLGFAFAANTLVIVLLQLVVLRRIEGLRRTRVIVAMCAIWAVSWACLGASSWVPHSVAAALLVGACASVFALGETLLQPTVPAIVNDMAPDHLRGRYNSLSSAGFQLASIAGPPLSGVMIGAGLGAEWLGLLFLGLVATALVAIRWVEPNLSPEANGIA